MAAIVNKVYSRRRQDKDGEEMYEKAKRTCRACSAFVFVH